MPAAWKKSPDLKTNTANSKHLSEKSIDPFLEGCTMSLRYATMLLAGMTMALFFHGDGATTAQPSKGQEKDKIKGLAGEEIIQEFPDGGKMQTAWKVRYQTAKGFTLTGAWFKTSPNEPWLKVVDNIRLSEIFVPYNNGTRIYDIGSQGNY